MGAVVAIGVILTAARIPFSSEILRQRVIDTLSDRLDADVDLDMLTLRFAPQVHVEGYGLTVRHKGRTDVPPLITVRHFSVRASLTSLWRRHVQTVNLDGLDIQIPPDRHDDSQDDKKPEPTDHPPAAPDQTIATAGSADATGGVESDPTAGTVESYVKQVVIDTLTAPDARLIILRSDPKKSPRVWALHSLRLHNVGRDTRMPFDATLTNAVPPGEIMTSGTFGPWDARDPGRTLLDGTFRFDHADLGVFDGISGTLSARGSYGGRLNVIEIDGQTETPDFALDVSHHPVPLSANYHAIVDATNGNTTLDPVNATFLNTSVVARGGVYEVKNGDGRIIQLALTMDGGRLEDIMRLSVPAPKPSMTGRLHLTTSFVLPPGKGDVVKKLQLAGNFAIQGGRFTDADVQQKVNELSLRAQGKADAVPASARVASNFRGRFTLRGGQLSMPQVTFDVPGAVVELGGRYDLHHETIDFGGNLFMEAKLSQTTTGFKSLLLKAIDPLFRKDGRTVVPLKITGTRNDPSFGLDVKRALHRSTLPTRPGAAPPLPAPPPAPAGKKPTGQSAPSTSARPQKIA